MKRIFETIVKNKENIVRMSNDLSVYAMSNLIPGIEVNGSIEFPKQIFIIGAGGTGGWFLPKFVKTLNDSFPLSGTFTNELNKIKVILVDGDTVEDKNLIRQNFVKTDIGKNKAKILAGRYAPHLNDNVSLSYVDKYITDTNLYPISDDRAKEYYLELNSVFENNAINKRESVLIINLIDNGVTRKCIHSYASNNDNRKIYLIDVANDRYNGQLNFSDYTSYNMFNLASSYYVDNFDQINLNDSVSVFSCADADATEDQLFSANDMAATVLATYINNWINDGYLKYNSVKFVTSANMSVNVGNIRVVNRINDVVLGLTRSEQREKFIEIINGNSEIENSAYSEFREESRYKLGAYLIQKYIHEEWFIELCDLDSLNIRDKFLNGIENGQED